MPHRAEREAMNPSAERFCLCVRVIAFDHEVRAYVCRAGFASEGLCIICRSVVEPGSEAEVSVDIGACRSR